jgi:beta-lactamase class A
MFLFSGGCQILEPTSESLMFPTPFQKTLDIDKSHAGSTTTQQSTETKSIQPTKQLPTNSPSPTKTHIKTTQIFPEATETIYPKYPELAERIDTIITQAGGRWHIVIKEVDGPIYYSLLTEQRINIASVVKVPIALLFFKALEEKGVSENQMVEHLNSTGTGGRTFEQLLHGMLV